MRTLIYTIFSFFILTWANITFSQLSPPTLLLPPNNDTMTALQPTFDWTDVSGATSYKFDLWQGTTQIYYVENLTISSLTLPAPLTSGLWYYWRAAAVNATQTVWSGYWNFRTNPFAPPPAPVLSSPANGATGVSRNPTLDWNDVAGANYYQVQVSTNSGFNPPLAVDVNGISSSQYYVSNALNYGTLYYWRVKAYNTGGGSPWSTVWTFTTVISPPSPPVLNLPGNGATNVTITPLMDWGNVISATSYKLQIATDPNFNNTILDVPSTISQFQIQPGTLSGLTQYWWRVAAINLGGQSNWSAVWTFTTITGPPAAPLLVSPINHAINIARNVNIDWGDVQGAGSYRIQISTDSTFANPQYNVLIGPSNYTPNPLLSYNTKYYWRVNAVNNGGAGPWSVTWDFVTVPQPPAAPQLLAPPNNSTAQPLTPTFDWSDVTGVTYYVLQVATSLSFTNIIVRDTVIGVSQRTLPAGILQGSTPYWWRVIAVNTGGTATSVIWNFTTLATLGANIKFYLEGFWTGTVQRQDTVRIYIANSGSPFTFRDSTTGLISPGGTITTSFTNAPVGNYYIVVRHRNHIETWSSAPQLFSIGSPVNYDFTTAANKAYGNNMKQVGSVWVFYGGDANQDGVVNGVDYDNCFVPQFGKDGYISADFNGDTFVDGYDILILNSNLGKSKARP